MNILEIARKYNICFISNGWEDELMDHFKYFFNPYYNDLVKERRFVLFPGQYVPTYTEHKDLPWSTNVLYGREVFIKILKNSYYIKNFDYLIYIDQDCFLYDMETFDHFMQNFADSEADIIGPLDGGIICHRMQCSPVMINTFFTVYKTKKFKQKFDFLNYDFVKGYKIGPGVVNSFWYDIQLKKADRLRQEAAEFRKDKECLYTYLVENHMTDSVVYKHKLVINEKDLPYVMHGHDEGRFKKLAINNYSYIDTEPYYPLFYYLLDQGFRMDYIFVSDLYKDENGNVLDSFGGIASQIYYEGKPFALHTWLTRFYIRDNEEFKENYERINSLAEYAKAKKFQLEMDFF